MIGSWSHTMLYLWHQVCQLGFCNLILDQFVRKYDKRRGVCVRIICQFCDSVCGFRCSSCDGTSLLRKLGVKTSLAQ